MKERFMKRLEELRKEKGLSKNELGALIGRGKDSGIIGKYERGENEPGMSVIFALCEILGCTADYLIGRED